MKKILEKIKNYFSGMTAREGIEAAQKGLIYSVPFIGLALVLTLHNFNIAMGVLGCWTLVISALEYVKIFVKR